MQLNEHINNVMQLFVDSLGKLWIGTNDSGIASTRKILGERNSG